MIQGNSTISYHIDGNDLVKVEQYRDDTNNVLIEKTEIVMDKWAFIRCFEKWVLGERKFQIDQERRREEHEKEEREWKEKLARDIEEIHKNMMKGGVEGGN